MCDKIKKIAKTLAEKNSFCIFKNQYNIYIIKYMFTHNIILSSIQDYTYGHVYRLHYEATWNRIHMLH